MLLKVYRQLLDQYGPQGWWPVTRPGKILPEYFVKNHTERQRQEIIFGAILTQNTAWKPNVERAIEQLNKHGLMDAEKLIKSDLASLGQFIRSAGYFNQKAIKLKDVARFLHEYPINELLDMDLHNARRLLLGVKGIGPETADSILLYALDKPIFVVDSYTRRMFYHLGLFQPDDKYEEIQKVFMDSLRNDAQMFKEYHALIVQHAKSNSSKARSRHARKP